VDNYYLRFDYYLKGLCLEVELLTSDRGFVALILVHPIEIDYI